MTTWSIQYGDETGSQINRTTDDIGEVHATLEHIVKDEERTAGYAGQTATWRDYDPRTEDGYGVGNWTLDIVNLDTHTPDGYTIEEAAEMQADFYGADLVERENAHTTDGYDGPNEWVPIIAPKAERVAILVDMLRAFTRLNVAKPNLWVETGNTIPKWQRIRETDIVVRQTDGFTLTEDLWFIRLYETEATVNITHNGASIDYDNPMDALVWLHTAFQRY